MSEKKLLDKSPMSGIAVPLAIVLVGALIIWGVTQMLATGKNHRDLVEELHSKTFGNRWVAAYELSKYITSSSIEDKEIPWMVENLGLVYKKASSDPKTRNFVVIALGALKTPLSLPYLVEAVEDIDSQVSFNAIAALGKLEISQSQKEEIAWKKLIDKLESSDRGIVQVALITLAQQNIAQAGEKIRKTLEVYNAKQDRLIVYTATQALVRMNEGAPESIVEEVINLKHDDQVNSAQVEGLKWNLLKALENRKDSQAIKWLKKLSEDENIKISTKAVQLLNLLKK